MIAYSSNLGSRCKNNNNSMYYTFIILGSAVIYVLNFFNLEMSLNEIPFYLSFSLPTDALMIPALKKEPDFLYLGETMFPTIGIWLDILFAKYFGFNFIWVAMAIVKPLCICLVFYLSNKHTIRTNLERLALSIFLLAFYFGSEHVFGDRFSRPYIAPTLIIFSLFSFLENLKNTRVPLALMGGVSLGVVQAHDPWLFIMSLTVFLSYFIIKKKRTLNNISGALYFGLFCLLTLLIGNYRFYINWPADSLTFEFIGKKLIFDKSNFIFDYFLAIFLNKQIVLSFGIFAFAAIVLKNIKLLFAITLSLIVGALPYALIGTVVQPYHIIDSVQTLLMIGIILNFIIGVKIKEPLTSEIINPVQSKITGHASHLFLPLFCLLILYTLNLLNVSLVSNVVARANKYYSNYSSVFQQLSYIGTSQPKCKIISNELVTRAYTMAFTSNTILPSDGLYITAKINKLQAEISEAMHLTLNAFPHEIESDYMFTFKRFWHYSTHNLFAVSKSWASKSMVTNEFDEEELEKLPIRSFSPWNIILPERLLNNYRSLMEKRENVQIKDTFIVFQTEAGQLKTYNSCINSF